MTKILEDIIQSHQDARDNSGLAMVSPEAEDFAEAVAIEYASKLEKRIAELEEVERKANALYNSISTHSSGRKWVNQGPVDDLGFVLCDARNVKK